MNILVQLRVYGCLFVEGRNKQIVPEVLRGLYTHCNSVHAVGVMVCLGLYQARSGLVEYFCIRHTWSTKMFLYEVCSGNDGMFRPVSNT